MENEVEAILSQRLGGLVASVVLLYIFFWWKSRKKKRKQGVAIGEQKEKSALSEVGDYLKWRFKLTIGTILAIVVIFFLLNWRNFF